MNDILRNQIKFISDNCELESPVIGDIDNIDYIIVKKSKKKQEIKVIFENYIIHPFNGFDFHDKFNNGKPPFDKVMYGEILRETEKMYYLRLHTETNIEKYWVGWCPKKSCTIIK